MNRFSGDVWNVDDALPFTLNIFLAQSAGLLASILLTIYGLPVIAILILALIFPYIQLQVITGITFIAFEVIFYLFSPEFLTVGHQGI